MSLRHATSISMVLLAVACGGLSRSCFAMLPAEVDSGFETVDYHLHDSAVVAERSVRNKLVVVKKAVMSGRMSLSDAAVRSVELGEASTNVAEKILLYKGAITLLCNAGDFVKAESVYASMTNSIGGLSPALCAKILIKALEENCMVGSERLSMIIDQNLAREELHRIDDRLKEDPNNVLLRKKAGEKYVILGDWSEALKNFALSGGEYARIATEELNADNPNYRKIGDFWWLESNDIADMLHEGYRQHARYLYQRAKKVGR